ncbi:(deoxy)nucleoside triphosphate pyrophosphohydrolase [Alkalibacterium iburiense]|uniref:8-oxo-dGTP diphosphatase n=1 Tax=Alkalibacterium iburiense TaxID=290589 RepID=A0ABN0XSI4_9LACT
MKDIQVVGAIIMDQNRVLCAQRPRGKSLKLLWEFPGGKIEDRETPEEALIREIKEELGCTITVQSFFDKTSYTYSFGRVHLSTYLCKLKDVQPSLLEHHNLKWLPIEKLQTLEWAPADIPAVDKLQHIDI